MEKETVVLGDEDDDRLRDVLKKVLKGLGGKQRGSSLGLGGSQVIEELEVELDGELLHVEAETYMGLSITGLPKLVRRIRDLVNEYLIVETLEGEKPELS